MARIVLPVPARPSRATTEIPGSSSSSSAKRCSLLRGRRPHGSGAVCGSSTSSLPTRRVSADCEPARSTANSFSLRVDVALDHSRRRQRRRRTGSRRPRTWSERRPPDRPIGAAALGRVVLGGVDAEVGGLDAQRGVVRQHRRRRDRGLAEGGADDAVVGHRRIEPVLDQQVLLDAVDLDLHRAVADRRPARPASPPCWTRSLRSHRSAVRAARPTSSGRVLRLSSSSITVSGITSVAPPNDGEAVRIGDQHRRVETTVSEYRRIAVSAASFACRRTRSTDFDVAASCERRSVTGHL